MRTGCNISIIIIPRKQLCLMPADIQVNSVQCYSVLSRVWEYCFLQEICPGSSQLSLPPWQILRWFHQQDPFLFTRSCSHRHHLLRLRSNSSSRISSAILKTWIVPYSRGFILEFIALAYVTFLMLMQQVWTFVILMSHCKQAEKAAFVQIMEFCYFLFPGPESHGF